MKRMFTAALLIVVLAGVAARAGVDIDFGANVQVGDDANLFLSISSRYFDREPRLVEDWGRRYHHDPDDLAVALFLQRHGDRDPEFIFGLRQEGLGWFEISNRCRVPVDVYFLPVPRDPGPPYGKAYGHWKKHHHDPRYVVVLDDDDIRNLVAARMIHEYYGVPVEEAMRWRSEGHDVRYLVNREYRKRYGGQVGGGRHVYDKHDHGQHDHDKVKGDDHKGGKGQEKDKDKD